MPAALALADISATPSPARSMPGSVEGLLQGGQVWRGRGQAGAATGVPTGFAALDAVLPSSGWPAAALSELLLPADGVGELQLVLPCLSRLTAAGRDIALISPPYRPYPAAWRNAGVDLTHLHVINAPPNEVLWATEQCLRAGCLAAVLLWPLRADDRALRRLQVAAETGQAQGFVFRDQRVAANPSPAALRLQMEALGRVRVLKCRGGNPPARAIDLSITAS